MGNLSLKGILILLGLLMNQFLFSQKYSDNWVFGNFGLRFRNDSVIIKKDYAPHLDRSMGIISDENGELLFYTDGFSVWNKNHELMTNGEVINDPDNSNSVQISMVIPKPGSATLYYIFTSLPWNGLEISGLYYSVVDMSLQNGLGEVVQKKIKILDNTTNRITASFHSNLNDIWLIINKHGTNNYYSFLISSAGVSASPVISASGKIITSSFDGQLKASPDSRNIACSYNNSNGEGFDLFDFDNATGVMSNPRSFKVPVTYRGCDGMEFSSDATRLFVYQTGSIGESAVYEYDLSSQDYDLINKSRIHLLSEKYNSFKQMQLGPDGKIYITKGGGGGGTEHLGVIEHPNEYGAATNVKENGLYLEGGSSFVAKTPAFIQNYFYKTSFRWSENCQSVPVRFIISNHYRLDSVRWKFGDEGSSVSLSPQHTFNQSGTYDVTLFAHYPEKTDTITRQIIINPYTTITLGADTTVCKGYKFTLPGTFRDYLWNTGDTTSSIRILNDGEYKVTVKNSFGCPSSDSVRFTAADLPVINLPDTIELGGLASVRIDAGDFISYSWSTGDTASSVWVSNEGWYSVAVRNETGCLAARSVAVVREKTAGNSGDPGWILLNPKPTLNEGTDITFIDDQTGFLVTGKELIRTRNAGVTWEKVMDLASGKRIAFKDMIGYIVGDNGTIYKSTHFGEGWNRLSVSFTDNLNALSVLHPDTVRITSDTRIFATDDGGKTWKSYTVSNVNIEDSYFTSPETGHIACTNGRILKTTNGGVSWQTKYTTNISPSDFFRILFVNKNLGFATREHDYIFRTTDGGETWNQVASPEAGYGIYFINENTGFIAGSHGAIFKTSDGGKTWAAAGFGSYIGGNDLNGIFFLDENIGFATGMKGRIIKTINGGASWSGYALTYIDITQVQFPSPTSGYALVGATMLKTVDRGASWTSLGQVKANINTVAMDFTSDNTGYLIGGGNSGTSAPVNTVFKTTDGGVTWVYMYSPFYDNLYSIDFVDENTGFVSGGYSNKGVFKTVNGGQDWQKIASWNFTIMQFLNAQTGYARLRYNSIDRIYKTTDGGVTWSVKFENEEYINSFHFIDENTGFLAGDNAVIRKTTDGGTTWVKLTLPYADYKKIRFSTSNNGYLIDENGRLYQTMDGGLSWESLYYQYGINKVELTEGDIYISGSGGKILKNFIRCDSVSAKVVPVKNALSYKATLSGIVASNGSEITDIKFQYGLTTAFENSIDATPAIMHSNSADSIFAAVSGLQPNREYYYRIKLKYEGGDYISSHSTFRTPPEYEILLPNVNLISYTGAEVTGIILANAGEITGIKIQFGTDTLCNSYVDGIPNTVAGETQKEIKGTLTDLQSGTKYYIRISASYKGKVLRSPTVSFSTFAEYSISYSAPVINGNSATLKAQLIPYSGTFENIVFEYGKTRGYLNSVASTPNLAAEYSPTMLQATITNLESNTIYYYRIRAQKGSRIIYLPENLMKLEGGLLMVPADVQQLTDNMVVLHGLINPNNRFISGIQFEYGVSESLGYRISATPFYVSGTNATNIRAQVNNLIPMEKYFFRIRVSDGASTYYSDVSSFTLKDITGTGNNPESEKVITYPNPVRDIMFIKSEYPVERIELYDPDGKLRDIKTNTNSFDISGFREGFYFIRIYSNGSVYVRKIIVLK